MSWLASLGIALVSSSVLVALGFYLGKRTGEALAPSELCAVARQRDRLMRERDLAVADAQRYAMSHMRLEVELIQLRNAMTRIPHGRPN
jgi:hypothetical protein